MGVNGDDSVWNVTSGPIKRETKEGDPSKVGGVVKGTSIGRKGIEENIQNLGIFKSQNPPKLSRKQGWKFKCDATVIYKALGGLK